MGDNFHAVIAANHILTRAYGSIVLFMVLMRVWKEKRSARTGHSFLVLFQSVSIRLSLHCDGRR